MRSVLTCITRRTIVAIQTLPHTPLSEYTRENNIAKGKKSGQQGKHIQTGKQDSALPSHLSTLRLPQVPNEGGREAENGKVGDDVRDGVAEEKAKLFTQWPLGIDLSHQIATGLQKEMETVTWCCGYLAWNTWKRLIKRIECPRGKRSGKEKGRKGRGYTIAMFQQITTSVKVYIGTRIDF